MYLSCGNLGRFGGNLLGVRSHSGLTFYDWDTLSLIRRIEIIPKTVRLISSSSSYHHVYSFNILNRYIGVKMVK